MKVVARSMARAVSEVVTKAVAPTNNFYRRPLPTSCISFSSSEGRKIFQEALLAGHMEGYFRLASQLRTQDEPSFCGLATLVMSLNALEVDPGRIWKGPWRWYHEDMLDCCIPMEIVKTIGVTLDQFICIARCNGLTANVIRPDPGTTSHSQGFSSFVSKIAALTKCDDEVLVVSYSRRTLGQTGDGHFAPVGGFHPKRKLVLLFDTARFKYPPHWVHLDTLWEAMAAVDKQTERPRGYAVLSRDLDSSCQLLLGVGARLAQHLLTGHTNQIEEVDNSFEADYTRAWLDWLRQPLDRELGDVEVYGEAAKWMLSTFLDRMDTEEPQTILEFPLVCNGNFMCDHNSDFETALSGIVKEIVECSVGVEVSRRLGLLGPGQLNRLSERVFLLPKLQGCILLILQDPLVKMTFLLTSWLLASGLSYHRMLQLPSQLKTRGFCLHAEVSRALCSPELAGEQTRVELGQLVSRLVKMHHCAHSDSQDCCRYKCGPSTGSLATCQF